MGDWHLNRREAPFSCGAGSSASTPRWRSRRRTPCSPTRSARADDPAAAEFGGDDKLAHRLDGVIEQSVAVEVARHQGSRRAECPQRREGATIALRLVEQMGRGERCVEQGAAAGM
jgi:hypothetical protein